MLQNIKTKIGKIIPFFILFSLLVSFFNTATADDYDSFQAKVRILPAAPGTITSTPRVNYSTMGDEEVTFNGTFDTSTLYRKPIKFRHFGDRILYDYQASFKLDTSNLGLASGSCNEIRIKGPDGLTDLDFWIENSCPSTNTIIWVKIPKLPPANEQTTIYVQFGDSSITTSASNGDNTFEFFDDFSSGQSKWSETIGTGFSVGSGLLTGDSETRFESNQTFSSNTIHGYAVETRSRKISNHGEMAVGFRNSTTDGTGILNWQETDGSDDLIYAYNAIDNYFYNLTLSFITSYKIYKTLVDQSGQNTYSITSTDRSTSEFSAAATTNQSLSNERVSLGLRYDFTSQPSYNGSRRWDWIFVRKYSNPDVGYTSYATETLNTEILINDKPAETVSLSSSQITVKTPPNPPGIAEVEVVNPNRTTNVYSGLLQYREPRIYAISKNESPLSGGEEIAIYGAYFSNSLAVARKYTVNNPSGGTLTDFPIMIRMGTSGSPTNCNDIAVYEDDLRTKMFSYVEGTCPGYPTYVWTKFETLPSGNTDIYITMDDGNTDFSYTDGLRYVLRALGSPSLKIWLKGDTGVITGTGGVSEWQNQAETNYDATQTTTTNRPELITSASEGLPFGFPFIRFINNNQDFLEFIETTSRYFFSGTRGYSLYSVFRQGSDPSADQAIFRESLNSSTTSSRILFLNDIDEIRFAGTPTGYDPYYNTQSSTIDSNFNAIGSTAYFPNNGNIYIYRNNNSVWTDSDYAPTNTITESSPAARMTIGTYNDGVDNFLDGDIAEFLGFNRPLLDPQNIDQRNSLKEIRDYLMSKYRIDSSTPYYFGPIETSPSTVKVFFGQDNNDDGDYVDGTDILLPVEQKTVRVFSQGLITIKVPTATTAGNYDIVVENHDGYKGMLEDQFGYGVPSEPLNVEGKTVSYGVALDWDKPKSNGGSPITGYEIKYKDTTDTTCDILVYSDSDCDSIAQFCSDPLGTGECQTNYTIPNLDPTKSYTFSVYAINTNGHSGPGTSSVIPAGEQIRINNSSLTLDKNTVEADNVDRAIATFTARTASNQVVPNIPVKLEQKFTDTPQPPPGNPTDSPHPINYRAIDCGDLSTTVEPITDSSGQVCFELKQSVPYNQTFSVIVEGFAVQSTGVGVISSEGLGLQDSVNFIWSNEPLISNQYIFREDDNTEIDASKRTNRNSPLLDYERNAENVRLRMNITKSDNEIQMSKTENSITSDSTTGNYNSPFIYDDKLYFVERIESPDTPLSRIFQKDLTTGTENWISGSVYLDGNYTKHGNEIYFTGINEFDTPSLQILNLDTFTAPSSIGFAQQIDFVFSDSEQGSGNYIYTLNNGGRITKARRSLPGSSFHIYNDSLSLQYLAAAYDETNRMIYAAVDDPNSPNYEIVRINTDVEEFSAVNVISRAEISLDKSETINGMVIDESKNMLYVTTNNSIIKVNIDPDKTFRKIAELEIDHIHHDDSFGKMAQIDTINRQAYFNINNPLEIDKILKLDLSTFSYEKSSDIILIESDTNITNGFVDTDKGKLYLTSNNGTTNKKITEITTTNTITPYLQWGEKPAGQTCDDITQADWSYSGLTPEDWQLTSSAHFTDDESTTKTNGNFVSTLLTAPNLIFNPGNMESSDPILPNLIKLGELEFTELEFNLTSTNNPNFDTDWCFRIVDNNTYDRLTANSKTGIEMTEYPEAAIDSVIIKETRPVAEPKEAPSTEVKEGGGSDSYNIKLVNDNLSPINIDLSASSNTFSNGNTILSFSAQGQTITGNQITLSTSDPEETIFVTSAADSETQGEVEQTLSHAATGTSIRDVIVFRTDLNESISNVTFNVTGEVVFDTPPTPTFNFPPAKPSNNPENYLTNHPNSPITFTLEDTTGPSNDWLLQLQATPFSINKPCSGSACCVNASDCIPLDQVYITTSNFTNSNTSFSDSQIATFVDSYKLNTEDISDPNSSSTATVFRNNTDLADSAPNDPLIIDLIDTALAPGNFNGLTSLDLHLMIDYPNIPTLLEIDTYEIDLVFTIVD
ncbi:DUF2341 domain-containing protein [Candidatus Peregrinibacteria bacterium]|nr:DUF2341 domain-containing protein [Candidatus Peregrinibacteria bacterium]